ncbi:MAG: hypothetical protein Q9166_004274 [cf. Caloplaca sp. 2 TL-2023]
MNEFPHTTPNDQPVEVVVIRARLELWAECLPKALAAARYGVPTSYLHKLTITPWLVFLLALVSCVSAGHGWWERSIKHNVADKETSTLEKRYFIIQPQGTLRVWPNAEIRYCFDSDQTRQRLLYSLQAARDRWYAAGLPENRFKLTEVSASECKDRRSEVLLITYNTEGRLATTPGLPPLDANDPEYKGPSMTLSDSTNVGMLEVIANYAHELGHAWGLLHEHQDPTYWSMPYSTQSISSRWTFQCQNLKDYAEVAARLSADDMTEACRSRTKAAAEKFSAAEYLPILGRGRGEGVGSSPDMTSIMLYPSGAGALGSASPGNDQRQAILLNNDGSRIPINLQPSRRDIDGILKLYDTDWGTTNPVLIDQPSSSKFSRFKEKFKRKKCDG